MHDIGARCIKVITAAATAGIHASTATIPAATAASVYPVLTKIATPTKPKCSGIRDAKIGIISAIAASSLGAT